MTRIFNGRPEEKVIKLLEEAFRWGCSDKEAALHADIGKSSLYRYIDRHPDFGKRKEILKNSPTLRIKQKFYESIDSMKPELCLKYLEKKNALFQEEDIQENLTESIKQHWQKIFKPKE